MTEVPGLDRPQLQVMLYDDDLATPTFIEDLTQKVQGLRFSTGLHGGFKQCTFTLPATLTEQWEWLTTRLNYRLVITDRTVTVWEGRFEEPKIHFLSEQLDCIFYGYYASTTDQPYHTAYNAVASVVIKAALTAACPDISADQSNIDATDITIDSAAGPEYLDISVQKLIAKLLDFSDSTDAKWYFAIWEDRVPYLSARSVSSLDWTVRLADFVGDPVLAYRMGDLWNSVYAIYGAVLTRTADADDANSQTKYGVKRQKVIPDLGAVAQASAEAQRDAWLADHKDAWPRQTQMLLGPFVTDANGVSNPSCHVRAGDVLRIIDLVPSSVDATTVTRDALRTFFIAETDYNVDTGVLRIIPDTSWAGLDAIIASLL